MILGGAFILEVAGAASGVPERDAPAAQLAPARQTRPCLRQRRIHGQRLRPRPTAIIEPASAGSGWSWPGWGIVCGGQAAPGSEAVIGSVVAPMPGPRGSAPPPRHRWHAQRVPRLTTGGLGGGSPGCAPSSSAAGAPLLAQAPSGRRGSGSGTRHRARTHVAAGVQLQGASAAAQQQRCRLRAHPRGRWHTRASTRLLWGPRSCRRCDRRRAGPGRGAHRAAAGGVPEGSTHSSWGPRAGRPRGVRGVHERARTSGAQPLRAARSRRSSAWSRGAGTARRGSAQGSPEHSARTSRRAP